MRDGVLRMLATALVLAPACGAGAETLPSALAKAYRHNPQLNAQRAVVRQTDEQVPLAMSGYRPQVAATVSAGPTYTENRLRAPAIAAPGSTLNGASAGLTASQTVLDGFRTYNQVRAAEGNGQAAREVLRLMTQQVLLDATAVYMSVLRDSAVAQLQRRNVEMLQEQLRLARERLGNGEVTRTDVSQAESRLAAARWQKLAADATLNATRAAYRRVIGEDPGNLTPGTPVDRMSPRTLEAAIASGQTASPSVTSAQYGVDVAALQVKIAEGALYPMVQLQGAVQHGWLPSTQIDRQLAAGAFVTLSVPIYQGGAEYATIRQSKEAVGQKAFDLDRVRDLARAGVVEAWGQLAAARAQIEEAQAQVAAAEAALNGVMQEARAGQRTTLDVLNAQQELVNARITLVTTQRERVVASYALLAAVGRLAPEVLGLPVDSTGAQAAAAPAAKR
jgi:outer membrane protein